ncbi:MULTISPECIES: hypothetical protein [Bacillus]|uniref:Uncharacterized protein n=1 Tax=Bacillus wiedmannii TaxID=1890302 RepID=A0A2B6RW53_9BACI|nr:MULTISPECIES: hypothetical protein [Bacillus]MDF9666133.1 hypothetical protein [Bacillus wiedmannii]MDI6505689.1 hypothetical protein [Bacillus wiedmannii]MDI6511933.1 hypothetical protein [Bacillus wiedmannii]PFZ24086.1 hypothetical protein COL51_18880 [Bacillus wiedmannii]PGC20952.1 hypothetical protein COM08_05795 [Bacillus wiedmannii]
MKGKVFTITTFVLLATVISTSAFYSTLSVNKSDNLLSYRAQTTTNQNASRCSVAISFINSNGIYTYIESASDKLGSHEFGRANDSGIFRDYSDSERSFTSCIESSSFDCCKRKVAHRISMRYFFMYKKIPLYEGF